MHILLLAPQPFYQDRGTPLAVDLLLQVLAQRGETVDVVTYHEGRDVTYTNVTLHRIRKIPFVRHIRPGFSWKKVVCDALLLVKALHLLAKQRYHVIHAVEESVFIALILGRIFKTPYIYDMDSSLSQQLADRFLLLKSFRGFFNALEGVAVRHAKAVMPVCDALAGVIARHQPQQVVVLRDVPLIHDAPGKEPGSLKVRLGIAGLLLMYVGNLEAYQGIDLLLESFALVLHKIDRADLAIIGGEAADLQRYQEHSCRLGISQKVHFLGPQPVSQLATYLAEADILVSPRIKGSNTPMKLYSYLHSGKAIVATDLPTHTQILDSRVAVLAKPDPQAFAQGLLSLMEDATRRQILGTAGKQLVEEKYNYTSFCQTLNDLFDWLVKEQMVHQRLS